MSSFHQVAEEAYRSAEDLKYVFNHHWVRTCCGSTHRFLHEDDCASRPVAKRTIRKKDQIDGPFYLIPVAAFGLLIFALCAAVL